MAGITDQQIRDWLSQNPNATDRQIAAAMAANGIDMNRMGSVFNTDPSKLLRVTGGDSDPTNDTFRNPFASSMNDSSLFNAAGALYGAADNSPLVVAQMMKDAGISYDQASRVLGDWKDAEHPAQMGINGQSAAHQFGTGQEYLNKVYGPQGTPTQPNTQPPAQNLGIGANGISYGGVSANDAYQKLLSGDVNTDPYNKVWDAGVRRMTNNFNRNVLPGIGQGAIASGQYGGSRQGIAEGLATEGLNNSIADFSANLYGGAYNNAQNLMANAAGQIGNFGLQDYSNVTNRAGTMGGLQIADYNAQTSRFGTQANAQNQFMNTQLNAANGAVNLGLSANNYPWQQLGQYSNIANSSGGLGNSTNQTNYTNPYLSAIGGASAFNTMFNQPGR